jgi:hypothetical protein
MTSVKDISQLDLNSIKNSIKTFLKSQTEFQDYNFEGSGLNVLMEILSYNTQYISYYTNMIGNEMFIDSALLRSSIVSSAKLLGYTPNSSNSAKASIKLQFNSVDSSINSIIVPANTIFTSSKDGKVYLFYNPESYTALRSNNFITEPVNLIEGKKLSFSYVVDTSNDQKYEIPNDGVDISTVLVNIQNSVNDIVFDRYKRVKDFRGLDSESKIFYIEENSNGRYQIFFGDGLLGTSLENGNVINIEYNLTSGSNANNINLFSLSSIISGNSNVTVTTITPSYAGSEKESKESIRNIAPKSFQTQNRAVTSQDYRNIILRDYPNILDVKVWGGEDAVPRQYGKVFIALLPKENLTITKSIEEFISTTILKPVNISTVTPEFVSIDYLEILPIVNLTLNNSKTVLTTNQIIEIVKNIIVAYAAQNLFKFDKTFYSSNLSSKIDSSEPSIVSNEMSIKCRLSKKTFVNSLYTYEFNFNNAIRVGSIISSAIQLSDTLTYYIEDDSLGNLKLFRIVSGEKLYSLGNIGTVNYSSGLVKVNNISALSKTFEINMIPKSNNIVGLREQILSITRENITINTKNL